MSWGKYLLCIGCGFLFFAAAELADTQGSFVENGQLKRSSCGQGELTYEFYVEGLEEEAVKTSISVPEQQLSQEQFDACVPKVLEILQSQMIGENPSLQEVRKNLNLETIVPEYGMEVSWSSEKPELVSALGTLNNEFVAETGETVCLYATLRNGKREQEEKLYVTVYPPIITKTERFLAYAADLMNQNPEEELVVLPDTFEESDLSYRSVRKSQNSILIFLGVVAAVCLWFKEKSDIQEEKKRRERSLMEDYPDLISGFLILNGAGYPAKAAWKKLYDDFMRDKKRAVHPLTGEMQIAVNQMNTGMPETKVYAEFGRRCGVRCYIKFASLLESSIHTGGKNLKKLLEAEMEDAFKQRADIAKRKGEEASSRLLIPMFGMLIVVMVMVVAPAFLSLS